MEKKFLFVLKPLAAFWKGCCLHLLPHAIYVKSLDYLQVIKLLYIYPTKKQTKQKKTVVIIDRTGCWSAVLGYESQRQQLISTWRASCSPHSSFYVFCRLVLKDFQCKTGLFICMISTVHSQAVWDYGGLICKVQVIMHKTRLKFENTVYGYSAQFCIFLCKNHWPNIFWTFYKPETGAASQPKPKF